MYYCTATNISARPSRMMSLHALLYLLYLRQVVYYYDNVYKCLSTLSAYGNLASQSNFGWKNDKPPPTVIEGHPRLLAEGFEQLRVVRDYRTPRYALRVVRDYRTTCVSIPGMLTCADVC